MKRNILYFSSFEHLRWGGQKSLFHLVISLDSKKYRPIVCVPSAGSMAEELTMKGIEVIILNLPKLTISNARGVVRALREIMRAVDRYHIDLLHTDAPRNTFYAGMAARIKNLPLIWHVRVSSRDIYDPLLYLLAKKIILVAGSLRKRFTWARWSKKFETIHNGVDLEKENGAETTLSGEGMRVPRRDTILLAAFGRIEPLKGQKYLIETCSELRGGMTDIQLLLVGDMDDAAYLKECEETAQRLGMRNHVRIVSYLDDARKLIKETDIIVSASLSEAFPRTILEAMAAGKPVVVTNVGGCSEAVEDGVTGFVVPAAQPAAMAEKLRVLTADQELRLQMGNRARIRAESMFSLAAHVCKTEMLYESIAAR